MRRGSDDGRALVNVRVARRRLGRGVQDENAVGVGWAGRCLGAETRTDEPGQESWAWGSDGCAHRRSGSELHL